MEGYLVVLEVLTLLQLVSSYDQAFVQTDGEVRSIMEGMYGDVEQNLAEEAGIRIRLEDNLPIHFTPPQLDFTQQPVGIQSMKQVTVFNPSLDRTVEMLSIIGSTADFHCSFFENKILEPGSNTTFDVAFLGRLLGQVESTLFIHTTEGSFTYQVRGIGVANPFGLRPLVGVRMPLNSSFSPLVHMYNPYNSTLQIEELYSSGGDLHLELPSGHTEGPQHLWEIPPYESKPVIRIHYLPRHDGNHTAFLRIRTNNSNSHYLVLPIEVEVSSKAGIFCPSDTLDFGIMRSQDEAKTLRVMLYNSAQKPVIIQNVIVTPVNEAVEVDFNPVKVPSDTLHGTQVATITFSPSKAVHPKQYSGKILIKSKNSQYKVSVPYQVIFMSGKLDYNPIATHFYVDNDHKIQERNLTITNTFGLAVFIHNATLHQQYFKIHNFVGGVILPKHTHLLLRIQLSAPRADLQIKTFLRLHTNLSHFDIPILCYNGRLKVVLSPGSGETLDLGTVGVGEKKTVAFAVLNQNPVELKLRGWGSNLTHSMVELIAVSKGNVSEALRTNNFSGMSKSLHLRPYHFAVYRIVVEAPDVEGTFWAQVFLHTQFEQLYIPFRLKTARGTLSVNPIPIRNTFPSKISKHEMLVESTFHHSMTFFGIRSQQPDVRFYFQPLSNTSLVLKPQARTALGTLYYDPSLQCQDKCYTGFSLSSKLGQQWLGSLGLNPVGNQKDQELDVGIYSLLSLRFHSELPSPSFNTTLLLETSEVRELSMNVRVDAVWPRLALNPRINFPLTQVGNQTSRQLLLRNPSSQPLAVQLTLYTDYTAAQKAYTLLQGQSMEFFFPKSLQFDRNESAYKWLDLEENAKFVEEHRQQFEAAFGTHTAKNSIVLFLAADTSVKVNVGFHPLTDAAETGLLFIRNNLTGLEAVVMEGQGAHGQIKFQSRKPGSSKPLLFELQEKQMNDCDDPVTKCIVPNFSVVRVFTAKNVGQLPVYVSGFDINGSACEGFGFKVIHCEPFELAVNASKKIEMEYVPDWTLGKVEATLHIHTTLGKPLPYKLAASISSDLLNNPQVIPRPFWEKYLHYAGLVGMFILVLCNILVIYMEANRILKSSFVPMVTISTGVPETYDHSKVFNLKNISDSYTEKRPKQNEVEKKRKTVAATVKKPKKKKPGEMTTFGGFSFLSSFLSSYSKNEDATKKVTKPKRQERGLEKTCKSKYDDETSSTTTEASSLDEEHKASISSSEPSKIADGLPTKKNSSLMHKSKSLDSDFQLSTKSRAHKKIKVDTSKIYGGDIYKPHTIELPYKLPPVKVEETPPVKKQAKVKGIPVAAICRQPTKPIPNPWDTPVQSNVDESFKDIYNETQEFGRKFRTSSPFTFNRQKTAKVAPIGKVLPELKKDVGTIGKKPDSYVEKTGDKMKANSSVWPSATTNTLPLDLQGLRSFGQDRNSWGSCVLPGMNWEEDVSPLSSFSSPPPNDRSRSGDWGIQLTSPWSEGIWGESLFNTPPTASPYQEDKETQLRLRDIWSKDKQSSS